MKTILFFKSSELQSCRKKLAGVSAVARKLGWNVQAVEPVRTEETAQQLIDLWKPGGCIVSCGAKTNAFPSAVLGRIPHIFIDRPHTALARGDSCVYHDSKATANAAARELLSLGLRHYAYANWPVPQDWNAAGDWGREKTLIENISFSGIVMDRIHGYPITVRVFDPAGFDAVRNVSFANMTCKSYGLPQFWGARGRPLEDFSFSNCRFIRDAASAAPWETAKPFDKPGENPFLHCRNFSFNGVSIDE